MVTLKPMLESIDMIVIMVQPNVLAVPAPTSLSLAYYLLQKADSITGPI